jgi:hypothetical protein
MQPPAQREIELAAAPSRAEPRVRPPPPPPGDVAVTVAFLGGLHARRDALEQAVAVVDCCTYNIDSLADALDAGSPGGRGSSALAEEVARAAAALAAGKRALDALKAEGEALARAAPGAARLPLLRAAHARGAAEYLACLRLHQAAKERLRAVEVDALVAAAVAAAGGGGGGGGARAAADVEGLRRAAARDPAGFAAAQAAAQVARQQAEPSAAHAAAYDDAAARADEVALLVRSIREIQLLVADVAALVEHQAEDVGSIAAHAERAGAHVAKANEQLEGAARKRACRRRCCAGACACGLVLTALGVAALVLFVTGAYKALLP